MLLVLEFLLCCFSDTSALRASGPSGYQSLTEEKQPLLLHGEKAKEPQKQTSEVVRSITVSLKWVETEKTPSTDAFCDFHQKFYLFQIPNMMPELTAPFWLKATFMWFTKYEVVLEIFRLQLITNTILRSPSLVLPPPTGR